MVKNQYHIHSFEDLQREIKSLKETINEQEVYFKESPVVKIAATLSGKKSLKSLLSTNFTKENIMSDSKLVNTILLSNKFTRKYFVGFTIAKEIIPYTFHKIAKIFKKDDQDDTDDTDNTLFI